MKLYLTPPSNHLDPRAEGDAEDAPRAGRDVHDRLQDRAGTERVASLVAPGFGVALVGVAVYRWQTARDTSSGVAIAPTKGGGQVVFSGRW